MTLRITNRIPEYDKKLTGAVRHALKDAGHEGERLAIHAAPVDTGRYRSSIGSESDESQAVIYANAEYSKFIEEGHDNVPGRHVLEHALEAAFERFPEFLKRRM